MVEFVHDPDFSLLPLLLRADAFVVDVGANEGQSINSIKFVLPYTTIHSFEPNPAHLATLQDLARQHENVTIHRVALGAAPGVMPFYFPTIGGVKWHQWASMVPDALEKPWVKGRMEDEAKRLGAAVLLERFDAEVRLGDDYNFVPDLIKIDSESSESEVAQGFHRTIKEHQPIIFAENGDWPRLWPFLRDLDYDACVGEPDNSRVVPYHLSEKKSVANTFFMPKRLAHLVTWE